MTIKAIANKILLDVSHQQIIIIGIEGFGGSGKSTIATELGNSRSYYQP
ncbi:MAG TPA: hypothetical protein VMQ52_00785 [Candidatus Saccharimonadales bacterium]|nr:hypothetical protein [Candidatus Saccharimonadales bacterium]